MNELLSITGKRQTDYAMVHNYSPSEISRYVTGTRLPPMHLVDALETSIVAESQWLAHSYKASHKLRT
ncbi:MAG: helix-turn-helix domain-containing protein [Clostridiales bacterium]|nr:helix-turn-helix domain-containing protein [Clostridiales bacterium]